MEDKFKELMYLQAKSDLTSFINQMPNRYGLTFILISEMLRDISSQVNYAAVNDRKELQRLFNEQQKNIKEETGGDSVGE